MTITVSRTHQVRRLLTVAGTALAVSIACAGTTTVAAAPAASSAHDGAAARTRAHAVLVGEAVPGAVAPRTAAPVAGPHRRLPVLRPHSGDTRARQAAPSAPAPPVAPGPPAGAAPVARGTGAPPTRSFAGVSAVQNKQAAGYDLEPPDEGLGAGNGYVVNFVNVTGAIYRPDGRRLGAPFYLNTFFQEDPATNTSDPRVYYDASSGRWFATMVEYQFNADGSRLTESHVDLATSTSGDPRASWRVFRIPTSNPNHASCPCLADFPMLGFDGTNVYVTTAEFTSDLNSYNGAQVYAISKRQLVDGAVRPSYVWFQNLSVGGQLAGHVQPAQTTGSTPAEYFVSSNDPDGSSGDSLAVWAMTNTRSVSTGSGLPSLGVRLVASEHYTLPPDAQTPVGFCSGSYCVNGTGAPTTGVLATDFDEVQEVQLIDGNLVTALNTGFRPAGDGTTRSAVAWFVIRPRVSGSELAPSTAITRQGYVARRGQYLMYPHINRTADGAMALVFGLTAADTFPAAAYAVARPGHDFGGVQIAARGTQAYHGFGGTTEWGGVARWGDYSNGQVIAGTKTVWLATEYVPGAGNGNENWGNRIFQLRLP